ncbi:ribosome maturation factor RimP [Yinghuangia sp. ASG 101]|uniref:ribosome maturation factor RimP n=1 Tax=Yinghuangia sp. ASG 101 TaxID=2896848 RepID=UPI001E6316FA|nr:ribosome maturation factor RimP [Yinghuangia sp. ASG 101]UGQ09894.1 ribosome maturation factor RimP [Yinghuangia sp. ASG 101]
MSTQRDRLRRLLEPVASRAGVDLEDVSVTPAGKRRVLRVVVDADGGVDLDGVAAVSRGMSDALDASDVMGSMPYQLEVGTPGVDRPLTAERHWRRARGRLVAVRSADGVATTGRVTDADADGVELDVDGTPRRLAYDEIAKATVQVEFNRKDTGSDGVVPDADDAEGADDDMNEEA